VASLREQLGAGRSVVGCFVQIPHPLVCELLADIEPGLDYLCVEGEHSGMNPETVQGLVATASLAGSPALVRVADNTPALIAGALDAGAAGVIVPRIDSGAEAAAAVRSTRYPPLGERGVGPGRAAGYGLAIGDYLARANDEILLAVQVETRAAVERLDEILSVEGVDVVFVGPGDLAVSMGLPLGSGGMLAATIDDVLARSAAAGRATGIYSVTAEGARPWIERAIPLVLFGSDIGFLAGGARAALAALRGR